MSEWSDSDERFNALTSFTEEDERISNELLGPMYFKSRKPGYDGPQVKALDFKGYMKYVSEREHKRLYEQALYLAQETDAPEWHELPEDERIRIRKINDDYKKGMSDLGASISKGMSPKM